MSQFEMKEVRKAFFRLVEGLLMQSDNVPLLAALVDIVGAGCTTTWSPVSTIAKGAHELHEPINAFSSRS